MAHMRITPVLWAFLATMSLTAATQAGDWPQWRGPALNGSSDEKSLPARWTPNEILWQAKLPGPGSSTPIVVGDRVFLTSSDTQTKALLAMCYSARDGMILWQKRMGADDLRVRDNNLTSPSPASDGKSVYFLFGSGELVALDIEGKELWTRDLQKEFGQLAICYNYSSSLLLYKDRLYIAVLRRNVPLRKAEGPQQLDSFLLAIDSKTGKDIFRHVRPSDARDESFESYTTPVPFEHDGRCEIVVTGGDYFTGHDWQSGKEIWRLPYNPTHRMMMRLVPSPVIAGNLICASTPRWGAIWAIRGGGNGTLGADSIAWKLTANMPDVCTSLYYQGMLYVIEGDQGLLQCVDPATGKIKWEGKLNSRDVIRSSPVAADGKIYVINQGGDVYVLAAGKEFKILGLMRSQEGPCQSSLAIANGKVFIRTAKRIYCVGTEQAATSQPAPAAGR